MFEGFAEIASTRLWYWDTGGSGEAVILCHPASQSCQIWEYQRDVLVDAGFRVIAYSRRGHYRSEWGAAEDPGTTVDDLLALVDYLNIGRAHVLGAAAGGITATGFAVAHSDRVATLILAGTIVAPAEDDWRALYGRLGIQEVRDAVSTEFLELGPTYRASNPEGVKRFAELGKWSLAAGSLKQPLGVNVSWADLEQLVTPTLLVTGEADLFAPPPLQSLVAGHLRNHHIEKIREAGHAAYWEAPKTFNAIVLNFLATASES